LSLTDIHIHHARLDRFETIERADRITGRKDPIDVLKLADPAKILHIHSFHTQRY